MYGRWNRLMNILIGCLIGGFVGRSIFLYWDYRTHPMTYAVQSAPWYTGIFVNVMLLVVILIVCLAVKLAVGIVIRKKSGEDESVKRSNRISLLFLGSLVLALFLGILYAALPGSRAERSAVVPGDGSVVQPAEPETEDGEYSGEENSRNAVESEKDTQAAAGEETENTLSEMDTDEEIPEELDFHKDGKYYQKVRDLTDGRYYWASAVTEGKMVKDEHGCEHTDYYSQSRSFESLDGKRKLAVRRWDNLLYSAGEYLIYEYDGIVYVARYDDLYHPALQYDVGSTHGIITKVPAGYAVADDKAYTVTFYDEDFREIKKVEGYRAGENGDSQDCFPDGLMAVRDMETGLMGFMDQNGDLAIPCEYGAVSNFSDGRASVLVGAEMIPYTEDQGTVAMFDAQGGQWRTIDVTGDFVVEPSEGVHNTVSHTGIGGNE